MVVRQQLHKLLKPVSAFLFRRRQQLLYHFEYGHDMPFPRFAEFPYQQNRRRQDSFRSIVEVCVLSERRPLHSRKYDRFTDNLRVFLCLCLIRKLIRIRFIQIHILIHEVQEIIPVGTRRVAKIYDRDLIPVLLRHCAVITHHVAFGIR